VNNLRQLTLEAHTRAERQSFAGKLVKGQLEPKRYYEYLLNQLACYQALEYKLAPWLKEHDLEKILRTEKIVEDIGWLEVEYSFDRNLVRLQLSTAAYMEYVNSKSATELIPHLYVRHFGDMFGGAMIAKVSPGLCKYYEFENKKELIDRVRSLLTDNMAAEANLCFDAAIALFEELDR
jgi:heme oxygenase